MLLNSTQGVQLKVRVRFWASQAERGVILQALPSVLG
jgi:hypothetical protein